MKIESEIDLGGSVTEGSVNMNPRQELESDSDEELPDLGYQPIHFNDVERNGDRRFTPRGAGGRSRPAGRGRGRSRPRGGRGSRQQVEVDDELTFDPDYHPTGDPTFDPAQV